MKKVTEILKDIQKETKPSLKGRQRNKKCSCGSGKKAKNCCYRIKIKKEASL
jgi:uncharacterized protein YecA (UPF0149 family)